MVIQNPIHQIKVVVHHQRLRRTLTLCPVVAQALFPTLALVSQKFPLVSWRCVIRWHVQSPTTINDVMTHMAVEATNDT